MHSVAAATVNVSIRIALDAIWQTSFDESKETSVAQERLAVSMFNVESVAGLVS